MPVLVRLSALSIEIYQDPGVDDYDDVVVIDMTPLTGEIPQGGMQDGTRGENTALTARGMSSFRASRTGHVKGNVVNIYI